MTGDDQSDPFLWDEDRVVQELCTENRSWKAPPPDRLPDPTTLEAKLRECGVDGETLLTYGDEFGFDLLWRNLGIKKLSHHSSLLKAIKQFQGRSPSYRKLETQQQPDSQLHDGEDGGMSLGPDPAKAVDLGLAVQPALAFGTLLTNGDVEVRAATPAFTIPGQGVLSPALSPSANFDALAPAGNLEIPNLDQDIPEERAAKRRRVAPTLLTTAPAPDENFAIIPAEDDMLFQDTVAALPHAHEPSGFLGTGAMSMKLLTDPQAVETVQEAEDEFAWTQTQIPPGRRIQVCRAMKRFLRSGRVDRLEASQDQGSEKSLPVFGDSGDEGYDSETWLEIEEEENERLAREARRTANKRSVGKEAVAETVNNVIQELEARWLVEKKPKWDHKAWKIWQHARRNPYRLHRIDREKQLLAEANGRVIRFSRDIVDQQWSTENEVQRMAAGFLEPSVFDRKYQAWLIEVLQSPHQPPKPSTLPRPKRKVVKKPVLDEDEESLTSESDDMDAFIKYDDDGDGIPFGGDEMEIDSAQPLEQEITPGSPDSRGLATLDDDETASGLSSARATPVDHQAQRNDAPLAQPTPTKVKAEQGMAPTTPGRLNTSSFDPIEISDTSPSPVERLEQNPGLDDLGSFETIGEIGVEYWEEVQDAKRLVVAVLCKWSHAKLEKVYAAVRNHNHKQAWARFMEPSINKPASATADSVGLLLCLLFDAFISKSAKRVHRTELKPPTCLRLKRDGGLFASFHAFLSRILPLFLPGVSQPPTRNVLRTTPSATPTGQSRVADDRDPSEDHSLSDEFGSDEAPAPSTKKRRRRRLRDQAAHDLRKSNVNFTKQLAQRASQFHEKLASQGTVSGEDSRLIVNDTKESDEQGLIYINGHIGARIKEHQIEGVRFMWNQVVVDSSVRQGCLLAHTMGLGKTMQVITLLVVIAEAAASPDESVRSQIPESLRESKTLILCPASLVDNWSEEILKWAPGGSLGRVWRITSSLSIEERVATLQHWASSGGILIIGYPMFTNLINKGGEQVVKILQETPNIVVGDEAHALKNPASQRHQAAAGFKTMNRIAMTGSPLTNNVMDYYAMINWVAPGYLADIAEFRQRFANPIKEGLYADSDPTSKRTARRMLHILKETVDPKVHRRDIHALVNDLPKKKEYIITLPLTKLQRRLYEIYIDWVRTNAEHDQATAWSLVATLSRVLAHPFIFKTVAEAQKAKQSGKQAQILKTTKRASPAEDLDDDVEAGEEVTEEKEEEEEIPTDILFRMLGEVAVREIEDHALSNKIFVLMRILDECKKKEDKVLIFSQSIATLDYLENTFKRQRVVYQRLDGKTRMAKRQEAVKNFNQHTKFGVYLISTTAGGVGLNIHGANRVVIFDFRYTPASEQQAVGRAYRLGQSKPVYVYRLTIGGTFEDTIHNNAVFKTQLASRLVDKKNPDPWSKRLSEYFVMPRVVEQEDLSEARGQDEVLDALLASKDMEGLIRKITPTETFEKEETYEFTPEEHRENAEEIKLELLRLSNPEEFRRRELARVYRPGNLLGIPPQPPSSLHPRAIDGESHETAQITGNRSSRVIRIKVPEHLRDKSNPEPSVSAVVSGAESAQRASQPAAEPPTQQLLTMTPGQATASTSSHYPVIPGLGTLPSSQTSLLQAQAALGQSVTVPKQVEPNGVPVQELAAAVPQPILGSGSHFKGTQIPSADASRSSPADGPSKATSLTAEDASSDFPELLRVHRRLCDEGRHAKYHPHDLINRVKGVLAENRVERLPMMDKMQNLKKCSRDERFSEAMLSGHLEPAQLASMTRAMMEQTVTSLGGMAEAEFKQKVWTSKAEISNQARAPQQQQQQRSPAATTRTERGRTALSWVDVKRSPGERANRGLLRFISSPEPEDGGRQVATPPPDRRRTIRPGDSAESPQIID